MRMHSENRRSAAPGSTGLRRRDVLAGATLLVGATLAAAGAVAAQGREGHHATGAPGEGGGQHRYSEAKAFKKRAAVVAVANECIARGQACLSHCMETFVEGDTTMAECARAVQEMLVTCQAFAQLAANDSVVLKPVAAACVAVCEECEKQCREHGEHQPECRECADACADLVREAKKLLI
jgi:Cys-rich four helix bundle protein (predicted Tat secretion target)